MQETRFSCLKESKIRNFVLLQVFYNGMVAILTLFVNTFLLKSYGSSSKEVLFYNLVQAIAQPIAMLTSFWVLRKKSYLFTQRLAFVFYSVVLVILCIFGEKVAFLYPLFGVLISFGAGYYFGIYSTQMLGYTTDGNRDFVSGAASALSSVVSLTLPLVAGVIISAFDAYTGYRIVFGIVTLIALGALFITTKLAPIEKAGERIGFAEIFKTIVKDKDGRRIMIANGLDNCRSFTVGFYMTILVYNMIQSEMLVSVNSVIGGLLGIVGAALYGVIVTKNNRLPALLCAVALALLPCIFMCFMLNVYVLIVFYGLYNLTNVFLATPVLNTHFKVMEKFERFRGLGAQIHTVREVFVTIGRVIGVLLILFIPQTNIGIVVILTILMLTSVVNALLVRNIEKHRGENL